MTRRRATRGRRWDDNYLQVEHAIVVPFGRLDAGDVALSAGKNGGKRWLGEDDKHDERSSFI